MDAACQQQIEQLYLEQYASLVTYARCALPNEALAEEAVQETFRIACQKYEDLQASPNPRGWLINTLKYVISNSNRTRATASRLLADYMDALGIDQVAAEDREDPALLYGDLANTEEFELIREMAVEGRSHLEMAKKRGITVDACKKRVQRAREFLRKKIKL